jgi:iron uptake system EfeUOB component EfeO/EfeM
MTINDTILVALTADDKLITYDIDNNFKKDKEVQLEYQSKDVYKSNIFVHHKR